MSRSGEIHPTGSVAAQFIRRRSKVILEKVAKCKEGRSGEIHMNNRDAGVCSGAIYSPESKVILEKVAKCKESRSGEIHPPESEVFSGKNNFGPAASVAKRCCYEELIIFTPDKNYRPIKMKHIKPRILPLPEEKTTPETKQAYQYHKSKYNGRITNMKSTLGHSTIAFEAYMQWYPLYEEVKKILGTRLSPMFALSISEATDCPLCSTYFRKSIIEAGEHPDSLILSEEDQQVLSFGAAIALHKGFVSDDLYQPMAIRFTDNEMVILIAFAGIMIATNIFNNVIHTEIDEYLYPFIAIVNSQ